MVQTAITKVVHTLEQAETLLNLSRSVDPTFFTEWYQALPDLTEAEMARVDRIRSRYRYHRHIGHLAEGVVNLIVLSPLLELAGFYDPPFQLRAERSVTLDIATVSPELEGQILQGRLDFLVVQDSLWLAVLESKGTDLNLEDGIPQALAYMFGSPQRNPIYGMVTNGGQFVFLKLERSFGVSQYDISSLFSHLPLQNQLYEVLQILKGLKTQLEVDTTPARE
jgi:hypothetical protein